MTAIVKPPTAGAADTGSGAGAGQIPGGVTTFDTLTEQRRLEAVPTTRTVGRYSQLPLGDFFGCDCKIGVLRHHQLRRYGGRR